MVISSAVSAPNGAFDNVSRDLKVVFTGPMGAGKTTAIRAICEGEALSTDVPISAAEAKVGKGMLYLFGPEITFRATPHATFKFLFNGIYADGGK